MVTRSDSNFDKHCLEVFEIVRRKHGLDVGLKFIDYYYGVYKDYDRSYLDWKLAFTLLDDRKRVERIGTRWYACVGIGGEGKSTLMKNVLFYFDPSFKPSDRSVYDWVKVVHKWREFGDINTEKAILLDEPDEFAWGSQEGKRLRKILGKARQGKYFFAICATDLADIPNFLFKKLDGIFFIPYQGRYMYFKNRPKKLSYILQDIKRFYYQKGYDIFMQYRKTKGCVVGHCTPAMPFNDDENTRYIKTKKDDFLDDMGDFIKVIDERSDKKLSNSMAINTEQAKKKAFYL